LEKNNRDSWLLFGVLKPVVVVSIGGAVVLVLIVVVVVTRIRTNHRRKMEQMLAIQPQIATSTPQIATSSPQIATSTKAEALNIQRAQLRTTGGGLAVASSSGGGSDMDIDATIDTEIEPTVDLDLALALDLDLDLDLHLDLDRWDARDEAEEAAVFQHMRLAVDEFQPAVNAIVSHLAERPIEQQVWQWEASKRGVVDDHQVNRKNSGNRATSLGERGGGGAGLVPATYSFFDSSDESSDDDGHQPTSWATGIGALGIPDKYDSEDAHIESVYPTPLLFDEDKEDSDIEFDC
jgi:hypothetical protein